MYTTNLFAFYFFLVPSSAISLALLYFLALCKLRMSDEQMQTCLKNDKRPVQIHAIYHYRSRGLMYKLEILF